MYGFSYVVPYGGASESHWNVANAEFTAPTSGLYSINLNVFNNGVTSLGRTIQLISTTSIGSQYCFFNGGVVSGAVESSFNWTQIIWFNAGETMYFTPLHI